MKDFETINQLKAVIETYEYSDKVFESGVVLGLYYAVNILEHGKEYADKMIKMPKPFRCIDGKESGC